MLNHGDADRSIGEFGDGWTDAGLTRFLRAIRKGLARACTVTRAISVSAKRTCVALVIIRPSPERVIGGSGGVGHGYLS